MATRLAAGPLASSPSIPYRRDQAFFVRFAVALAVLIVFAFVQFAVRGFSNPATAPWWVHLHGVLMLAWLGLLIVQNRLAQGTDMALHRKLGWLGLGLVLALMVLGSFTGHKALELKRFPPILACCFLAAWWDGPLPCASRPSGTAG